MLLYEMQMLILDLMFLYATIVNCHNDRFFLTVYLVIICFVTFCFYNVLSLGCS
jgi:hypothetical protein